MSNRLTGVTGTDVSSFVYNGLGDRYQQIVNSATTTYQLDLAAGLVNVLADGENTYLYGNTVLAQVSDTQTGYYLPDVLGSVRQMTSPTGEVQLSQRFTPFGEVKEKYGNGEAAFGYTGQKYDAQTGLLYLRARYYAPGTGRFISHDTWSGDANMPMSYNKWLYVGDNPIIYIDPSGMRRFSYLFYFPGVGNDGTNYGKNEIAFLEYLEKESLYSIITEKIYPYGVGSVKQGENTWSVMLGETSGSEHDVSEAKAEEILGIIEPFAKMLVEIVREKCNKDKYVLFEDTPKVDFLGYSGGGPMAYSTAQALDGDLSIDNLFLLGSPWKAYNGNNNIGAIWEFWGYGDLNNWFADIGNNYGGAAYNMLGWREYNEGWRTTSSVNAHIQKQYCVEEDIYQNDMVKRIVLGDNSTYDHNSYFMILNYLVRK